MSTEKKANDKKFGSLMELREQICERQEADVNQLPIDPPILFKDLPENVRNYVHNLTVWWIRQAQADLLGQIMTGNPASDFVPELFDLARKKSKKDSVLIKKIRRILEEPDPHAENTKRKLYEIQKLLEAKQ